MNKHNNIKPLLNDLLKYVIKSIKRIDGDFNECIKYKDYQDDIIDLVLEIGDYQGHEFNIKFISDALENNI